MIDHGFSDVLTHESHLHLVRDVLVEFARLNAEERGKALGAELFYGAGQSNVYGNCFYDQWHREGTHDVIEIAAFSEVSLEQIWETVIHELAHTIAGHDAGHGAEWRAVAMRLGLLRPRARGRAGIENLDPEIIKVLRQIPVPQDGKPLNGSARVIQTEPTSGSTCPLGIGTQEGESRGPGSGSRLRLYMCQCPERPNKARVASDAFKATCDTCGSKFLLIKAKEQRPRKVRVGGLT